MNKVFTLFCFIFGLSAGLFSQTGAEKNKLLFQNAFNEYVEMLDGKRPISLKRAVFLYENAYSDDTLNYAAFCKTINNIVFKLRYNIRLNHLERYKTAGNYMVFIYLKEPNDLNKNQPYTYDFDDFTGKKDFSKMFVTKLLRTRKGNCTSFPLLYKILCDELGTKSCLATAPNHLYIKHQDEQGQWVNVELTNGGFPKDQWIILQLGISVEAIKSEIYMKPLSDKENIVLCMSNLATAYRHKYGDDQFVYEVANKGLACFPNNILLLVIKANCLLAWGFAEEKNANRDEEHYKANFKIYNECVKQINSLGYSEISDERYEEVMKSIEKGK
jgi:hypothetical protein